MVLKSIKKHKKVLQKEVRDTVWISSTPAKREKAVIGQTNIESCSQVFPERYIINLLSIESSHTERARDTGN